VSRPLITFQDVTFAYSHGANRDAPALQRFSLTIPPGSVTAILGPNGAGKTTLLHLTMGWHQPQDGQVLLNEQPVSGYSRRELGRWMGLVPQSEHVPFEYSLLEYVLLGRAPYLKPLEMPKVKDCQVALRALAQVGLDPLHGRSITTLSGGERQLVRVARAMAQQPRILLLDEPTSHLDLGNKSRLLRLLHELTAQGVTIVLTTHEPEVAAAVATHLVMMRDGQVLHSGPLQHILTGERLSATYGIDVQVKQVDGRQVVLWQ
jgi:iron complex transport system ATP-binding protein